ncbi:hypothetical protein TARUN_10056 [Trichoderma arundinaceum]|uniref:Uncharacterized protein n=1 Tax=Trichoderma arundinaceum TaxID=490622 RepID=A0A395N7U9_TRIAR|nr:hypothetical protein TARUN_10056 [Trichoderma arundinaceum]
MPLTRSAGQRTVAQNSNLNCRRNPSRQSRAHASRTSTQSNGFAPSTDSRRAREVSADTQESDSSASWSHSEYHHAPVSPVRDSVHRRSNRIAAGHSGKANDRVKSHSRSKGTSQSVPSTKKGDKSHGRGRSVTALDSPSKRRHTASHSIGEMPPISSVNWADLRVPYQFWVDVFLYARSEGGADAPNTNWLLQVATSLYQLIRPLTRLKELIFYTPTDQPPYRKLDTHTRWNYSDDIFLALASPLDDSEGLAGKQRIATSLKSWEWSGSLLGGHVANFSDILRIHQTPSFAHLTRLSFTNFQVPSLRNLQPKPETAGDNLQGDLQDDAAIDAIADTIAQLKFLKHLVFESSTIMTDRLLPLLPRNLTHLELINCWEIKSEDLAMFLITHGSNLRALTLMHNQSLNLAFLTILADACSSLRELRMNMSYFRHHDSLNDADPMYEFALLPDQVPRWPSSIRVIDIEHIRSWSVDTAQMFIQSLVDNARNLPNLRHLVIKTMLDIPWQARAALRSELRPMVERVFLRTVESPQGTTTFPQASSTRTSPRSRKRKRSRSSKSPLRRSDRIEAHVRSSHRHPRRENSSQRGQLGRPLYREPETDEDEFDITELSDSVTSEIRQTPAPDTQQEPAIQGLCDTVNIVFDNQKVRELQYSMEDFLTDDDESSGVEWDGDEDDDEYSFAIAF